MLHTVENYHEVNHWMACISANTGMRHGDGEVLRDEETPTFESVHLSLDRIVVPTVTDGDCGVDVQSIMLGVPRTRRFRDLLRTELCDFTIRHVGARALIACLFAVGDLSDHIGFFELAAAGAQMLVNDPQHGDVDVMKRTMVMVFLRRISEPLAMRRSVRRDGSVSCTRHLLSLSTKCSIVCPQTASRI